MGDIHEIYYMESSSKEEQNQNDVYIVEKILDKRIRYGKTQYYLKWKGYGDEDNSWEPEKNLYCDILIKEFEEKKEVHKMNSRLGRKRMASYLTTVNDTSSDADQGPSKECRKASLQIKSKADKSDNGNEGDSGLAVKESVDMTGILQSGKIPEKIIGATKSNEQIMFLIKWKNIDDAELIPVKEANMIWPETVIEFYENRLTWLDI